MFWSEVESPLDNFFTEMLHHVSVLLSDFYGFPGKVAQVAASCIAQCAETCKELHGGEEIRKRTWKNTQGSSLPNKWRKTFEYVIFTHIYLCLKPFIFIYSKDEEL